MTKSNPDDLISLYEFILKELPGIDNFYWATLRSSYPKTNLEPPSAEQLKRLDEIFCRQKKSNQQRLNARLYQLRREALEKQKQPVPCVAASEIAVVSANGDVLACEMLPALGNLKNSSFLEIWNSQSMKELRKKIAAGECSCTHECFLYPSFLKEIKSRPILALKFLGWPAFIKNCLGRIF